MAKVKTKKLIKILFLMGFCFGSAHMMDLHAMDVEQTAPFSQTSFNAYPQSLSKRIIKSMHFLCDIVWCYAEARTELHNCLAEDSQHDQELSFIAGDLNINASDEGLCFGDANMKDIVLLVFSKLCLDQNARKNLYLCSQVCTQWYQISKSQRLNPLIKMRYCDHLPKEYVDNIERGQQIIPLQLVRIIFDRQNDEVNLLERILQGSRTSLLPGHSAFESTLIERVERSLLRNLLSQLKDFQATFPSGSCFYDKQEDMLERINTKLIKYCLKKVEVSEGTIGTGNGLKRYKHLNIYFHGAVTRLTGQGIATLKEKIFHAQRDVELRLGLTNNKLRWLPDDLFPLPRIEELDLRNNLLHYLPSTIVWSQDHLKELYIGNHQGSGITCSCCDSIGRKTTGNTFKVVPSIVLQLNNLTSLDLSNVMLENFNEPEVYRALPLLKYVNLNHNNLMSLPSSKFEERDIFIKCIDNPVYKWLTTDTNQWKWRLYHLTVITLTPILRYPLISVVTGVGFLLYNAG